MMVFMVAGAPWCRGWKGEFGNQRAPGCVSRGFNQVTKGTPALLRGGDLLQLGLGAWRATAGAWKGHTEGEALWLCWEVAVPWKVLAAGAGRG